MQAGITKIEYNDAGQLDHNAGRFTIGIDLELVYNSIIHYCITIVFCCTNHLIYYASCISFTVIYVTLQIVSSNLNHLTF